MNLPKPGEPCMDGCGRPVVAVGRARPCYDRWVRAGRPAAGTPPPMPPAERIRFAQAANAERMTEKVAEYRRLRSLGFTPEQAASDLGFSEERARKVYETGRAGTPRRRVA